jgi:hypothetical protein
MVENEIVNGWHEWSKYVLKELERLNACEERIERELREIRTDLATLKVKAGMWGAIAGLIPALAAILYGVMK